MNRRRFDVLVVGGGPGGIAAAVCAAENGLRTAIVDENTSLGGQIWRSAAKDIDVVEYSAWSRRLRKADVSVLCGARIVQQAAESALLVESEDDYQQLEYSKLILATGARERFLPFPGWTLPNVVGAGGLQALVKSGLPISGKRVVIAGSGPLLLAVAAFLRKKGAHIPIICEQTSWRSLSRLVIALLFEATKRGQALRLNRELSGIPFAANSWVLAARGETALQSVEISRRGKVERIPTDYLAYGFHLVPNLELPLLLGCKIEEGFVCVDDLQGTSIPSIFCVGEPTGIGGVEMAIIQGEIAGLAVAGQAAEAKKLIPRKRRLARFTRALDRAYKLQPELRNLVQSDTIVCRCEDVKHGSLSNCNSWRAAKLLARCGMGACQGRVCGPATSFLYNWTQDSVRPPIFPTRVETLAAFHSQTKTEPGPASVIGERR